MAGKLKKKPSLRGKEVGEHRLCSGSNSRDKAGSLKVADENAANASMGNEEILDESTSTKSLNDKTVDELFDYVLCNLKEAGKILSNCELNDYLKKVKNTSASNIEITKQAKNSFTLNHRRKRT